MEVSMSDKARPITAEVKYVQKAEGVEHDFDLWVINLIQGNGKVRLYFRDFKKAFTLADEILHQLYETKRGA